jgi:uncharacterized repeat protein (TIGR03803 family)
MRLAMGGHRSGRRGSGNRAVTAAVVLTSVVLAVTAAVVATPVRAVAVTSAVTPSTPVESYRLAAADGGVFAYGDAAFEGSMGGHPLDAPVVGMAATPDGAGYWLVAADGGVFAFGDAAFEGSMGGHPLDAPVVGMAATPDGAGYWLVAADGGVFAFGDAAFEGSMGGRSLVAPVTGMDAAPAGQGYWLVAADGGVFAFGDAAFEGSMGGHPLAAPVTALAATPDGAGYRLVGSDGGVFAFGDAAFFGAIAGTASVAPVVGIASTPGGYGYWLASADGAVDGFGAAAPAGSPPAVAAPVVAVTGPGHPLQSITVLHLFGNGPADGWQPWGTPALVGGVLYGYTNYGAGGAGAIWSMDPTSPSSYRLVHAFGGTVPVAAGAGGGIGTDGGDPHHDWLRVGPDGHTVFGATVFGGADDKGTVYSLDTADPSAGPTQLHSFTGSSTDGEEEHSNPQPLTDPSTGGPVLFGLTAKGGKHGKGTLYEMGLDGSDFTVLYSFDDPTGSEPHGFVVQRGPVLYGMTRQGDYTPSESNFAHKKDFDPYQDGEGVVFAYDLDDPLDPYTVLHAFGYSGPLGDDTTDGANTDHGGLALVGDTLYGMATYGGADGGGVLFSLHTDGSDYRILHTFGSGTAGGDLAGPHGTPVVGPGGALFGMATDGGTANAGGVFEYLPGPGTAPGVYRVLSDFPGNGGPSDGLDDPVVAPQAGGGVTLYGQTKTGGVTSTFEPPPTAGDYGGNKPVQANGSVWSLSVSP